MSVAEDSLKITVDYESLNLLNSLQSKDKALGERFLEDILTGIRTFGIGNSSATNIALALLRGWNDNRVLKNASAAQSTEGVSSPHLTDDAARELSNLIFNALLSNGSARTVVAYGRSFIDGPSTLYPGQAYGVFQQLKPMLPEIEGG